MDGHVKRITIRSSRWIYLLTAAAILAGCADAESRKHSYLDSGESFFAEGNLDKAGVEVRNALQIDPRFVEARYLAGRIAEQQGELRAAVGHYRAALDENAEFNPARAALSRLLLFGGLTDDALELAEAGLASEPDNAVLLTVRGAVKARQGAFVEGIADAEAAVAIEPANQDALALLASLYSRDGRSDEAIDVVERGIERSPDSVELRMVLTELMFRQGDYAGVEAQLKRIVTLAPDELVHRARLARFFQYVEEPAEAVAVWRQAILDLPGAVEAKLALVDLLWMVEGEAEAMQEMQSLLAGDSDDSALELGLAEYLARRGRVDQAVEAYREIIEAEGVDADGLVARNRLATLELGRGNEAQADALVAEVLDENPRDNDALIIRANMALTRGETSVAIADLRAVLRDQPDSVNLLRALARAHMQNDDVALAEDTLRSAVQLDPGDTAARLELADLLLRQDKAEQALPLLEPLAEALEADPDINVLDNLFKAQLLTGAYAAALQTAEQMQQLEPAAGRGWYYAALAAEGRQDHEAARGLYAQALEKQPSLVEPLTALVRMDLAAEDRVAALDRVSAAAAETPNHSVALNLRGELLLVERQFEAAAESFERAQEAAPAWWVPYRGQAMAHLARQDTEAAVAAYERGIERTGSSTLAVQLAAAHERQGNPDGAIEAYERLVETQPDSVMLANNLAMLLLNYRGGDPAELDRAAELDDLLATSEMPAVVDTRGWLAFKRGDIEAALELLGRAARSAESTPEMRYHLGVALLESGDTDGARDELQAAVDSGDDFFGIDDARRALQEIAHER